MCVPVTGAARFNGDGGNIGQALSVFPSATRVSQGVCKSQKQ